MTLQRKYIPFSELVALSHRRAIVTGGAAGIGLAIAYRLAEAGAAVVIVDTNREKAQEVSQEFKSYGYQVFFVQCDVSKEGEVQDMVNIAVEKMGGIDILVNNAGIYPSIPLAQMTGSDFEQVISVNLKGTFFCSREVSRRMIEQGQGGCIINIASINSVRPSGEGFSAYAASKGGVLMLTKSMALELGRHGIRVNAIAPGGVLTEGTLSQGSRFSSAGGRARLREFISRTALGRMGSTDDIGRVALFLTSDLSSYMTGSLVVVDGGYLLS